jgi:antirestriction protein ArdC
MDTNRNDIYERITAQILQAVERGACSYSMPWHRTGGETFTPINAQSRKPYRGVNVVSLWAASEHYGYTSGIWGTYKQWSDLGAQVRKGEKSSPVVFWKFSENETGEGCEEEEGTESKSAKRILARGYCVFNLAQVDGYNAPKVSELSADERIAHADGFFVALGADIRHGGDRAYFSPNTDHIQMPPFEVFKDPAAYYGVLAHEATHWTGATHRLNRQLADRFHNEAYAAEELVAELGAAFVCAELGIANEPRPDHAAYVASWIKVLKNDKRAIFTAASRAQEAVDWMQRRQASEDRAAA